jgi:GNAT superfamily N-acetyltransferase
MTQPNLTAHATLHDGRPVTIRRLQQTDSEPLGAFFTSLSAETRRRYAPHPFDRATAKQICVRLDADPCMRFIVVLEAEPTHPAIIGYLILTPAASPADLERHHGHLHAEASAGIAPAVADAFQNQGVGSLLGRHVIACARDMSLQQLFLSGGVRAFNESAIRYYEKLGFRRAGEFWTLDPNLTLNYAMFLDM